MGTGDPGSKDSFPANNLTAGVDGETWVRTNKAPIQPKTRRSGGSTYVPPGGHNE